MFSAWRMQLRAASEALWPGCLGVPAPRAVPTPGLDRSSAKRPAGGQNRISALRRAPIDSTLEAARGLSARGEPAATVARRSGVNDPEYNHSQGPAGPRFLLWIDGVGGYLVCESSEVVLGQPLPDGRVDIPIQGDISRDHAVIRRDGEGYVIVPRRRTQVAGRLLAGPEHLPDGALIELGAGVRLRFRKPHPLSATARLEFVSHHRTRPAADAVLLLAESLVLGSSPTSHIECLGWTDDIVLFRQGAQLFCKAADAVMVDGVVRARHPAIHRRARIAVGDRTFCLEELEAKP